MTLPLVILGSARQDGDTARAVALAFPQGSADIVPLPAFHVGGYDYAHGNSEDGFPAIAEAMRKADHIVFATPVYWYAMSAPLKIFFDRLTDMTQNLKSLGKRLAGKPVWMIATGEEDVLPDFAVGGYDYAHANADDASQASRKGWRQRRKSSSPPRSTGTP